MELKKGDKCQFLIGKVQQYEREITYGKNIL